MTPQQKFIGRLGILLAALLAGISVAGLAPLVGSIGNAGFTLPALLPAAAVLHVQPAAFLSWTGGSICCPEFSEGDAVRLARSA